MMWSIGICITTDNEGIRTAIKNLIPNVGSLNVNSYDYRYDPDGFSDNGTKQIRCEIRFDNKTTRDEIFNNLKGLNGVLTACDSPSYIRPHVCGGDSSPCVTESGGIYK